MLRRFLFILMGVVFCGVLHAEEEALSDDFTLDGKVINPGCVKELVTELNGDDVVSSIHLSRTFMRGCVDSNKHSEEPAIEGSEVKISNEEGLSSSYEHVAALGQGIHIVKFVDGVSGSMGASVSYLILRAHPKVYLEVSKDGVKQKTVTTLTKVGEISEQDPEVVTSISKTLTAEQLMGLIR